MELVEYVLHPTMQTFQQPSRLPHHSSLCNTPTMCPKCQHHPSHPEDTHCSRCGSSLDAPQQQPLQIDAPKLYVALALVAAVVVLSNVMGDNGVAVGAIVIIPAVAVYLLSKVWHLQFRHPED